MATTTISLKTEAYRALAKAKRKGQSFSDVILAYVRPPARSCGELLEDLARFEGVRLADPKLMKAVEQGRGRRSIRRAPKR